MSQLPPIAYSVGIDISAATFDACLQKVYGNRTLELIGTQHFKNTQKGFEHLLKWLASKGAIQELIHVGMEATGRYYEKLAYFLLESNYRISVVLPNKIKNFARCLNEYSKTDALDAQVIASYVSRNVPKDWTPISPLMLQLRELSREREALTKMRTMAKNRLSALGAAHRPLTVTVKRLEKQVNFLSKQIEQIEQEMDQLCQQDESLDRSFQLLCSVPYIGATTAYVIMAETDCFALFENRAQLIKYAGLDIIENQSGTSVKGKSRISKRGNPRLRSAPYPGLSSVVRSNNVFAHTYQAAIGRGMEKKQARTAVVRQVLRVAYGVHKSDQLYNENIHRSRTKIEVGKPKSSPTVTDLEN